MVLLEHLPIWAVALVLWLFGSIVVIPAGLLLWLRYERWIRERRRGEVRFAPSASRAYGSRRAVPPPVDRSRRP